MLQNNDSRQFSLSTDPVLFPELALSDFSCCPFCGAQLKMFLNMNGSYLDCPKGCEAGKNQQKE